MRAVKGFHAKRKRSLRRALWFSLREIFYGVSRAKQPSGDAKAAKKIQVTFCGFAHPAVGRA